MLKEFFCFRYIIFWFTISLALLACKDSEVSQQRVRQQCKNDRQDCSEDCKGGVFHHCYFDPEIAKGTVHLRKHCYGMHIGRKCKPCNNDYALNFGGAMREVKCEYFYNSLAKKNSQCDNCLERAENVEVSEKY